MILHHQDEGYATEAERVLACAVDKMIDKLAADMTGFNDYQRKRAVERHQFGFLKGDDQQFRKENRR